MGFVEKIKRRYGLRNVDKYTKRRMDQSQFESRDRDYYNSIYIDGAYLCDQEAGCDGTARSSSSSSIHRWSWSSLLGRNSQPQRSLATQQVKTSESYTLNG